MEKETSTTQPVWLVKLAGAIAERKVSLGAISAKLEAAGHNRRAPLADMLKDASLMGREELSALIEAVSPLKQWKQRSSDNDAFIKDALKWMTDRERDQPLPKVITANKTPEQPAKEPKKKAKRTPSMPAPMPEKPASRAAEFIGRFDNSDMAKQILDTFTNAAVRHGMSESQIDRTIELLARHGRPKDAMGERAIREELMRLMPRRASLPDRSVMLLQHAQGEGVNYSLKREAFLGFFTQPEERQAMSERLLRCGLHSKTIENRERFNADDVYATLAGNAPAGCLGRDQFRYAEALSSMIEAARNFHAHLASHGGRSR